MSDRILVMTYRPGKVKRIVDIDLAAPAHFADRVERSVRLREEASRGMQDEEMRARHAGEEP